MNVWVWVGDGMLSGRQVIDRYVKRRKKKGR